ncbi:MAG: decarboxylating NADP(+)-dependent phosphogluconate dehydrogenase [Candidatus Eremiobacteraeota bacterium]|nr:decarboxylating NADP(+)-dependent phosphogluconate dehydrogenase [Candidatus Eremiobacteraeota bacterium]
MTATADIGLIGLAVMGQNLVLNMDDHGYTVAVYNRTTSKVDDFLANEAKGTKVQGAHTVEELVSKLKRPRRVMIMVKAGSPVDAVINQLLPLLEPGDIIIDGGNSHYEDSIRRHRELEEKGFLYIGCGVSGGEEGARRGPSMMPGGSPEAWPHVKPIFQAIAAKVDDGSPCCDWVGEGGAGHYVKMVHNGIEYGDMQLIAESYAILKAALDPSPEEFHQIFSAWNETELSSFLIEITSHIFTKIDEDTGRPLVDMILDKAGQKGTGKWTSQNALDIGSAIPTITSAVDGRIISSIKEERVAASKILSGPQTRYDGDRQQLINAVRSALYASKICSYAQGMALLRTASAEYNYNLDLAEIARIWRAGCIIRAELLDDITNAYRRNTNLANLLVDGQFKEAVESRQADWRFAVKTAIDLGTPVPAMSASLAYFDAYRSARVSANLIQAQRDYFGAHTFERIDKPGSFHANWMGE